MSNGTLPPAQSGAERDSARRVLGQAFGVLSKELLSERPDGLRLRQAQKIVSQIEGVLASGRAESGATASRQGVVEPQTGVAEPVRAKASATTRQPLSTP